MVQQENRVGATVSSDFSVIGKNLRPDQAAAYLGISKSKLAKLRMEINRDQGPPFSKIAGCVVYRRCDLDAWIEANMVTSE